MNNQINLIIRCLYNSNLTQDLTRVEIILENQKASQEGKKSNHKLIK